MALASDADPGQVPLDVEVARLAAAQHGVFARDQLARLGATRGSIDHRLRTGRWERFVPGVFRLAGVPPSWHQSLMGACLAWGDRTVTSHGAAAALWRLAGFEPDPVELTVPRRRERVNGPGVVHRNLLPAPDVTMEQAIPVTTPARTLLDIASVVPMKLVEEAVEADGYRWHSGRVRWERDRARSNALTLLGWRVVHVTWTDLTRRPDAIVGSIRSALHAPH